MGVTYYNSYYYPKVESPPNAPKTPKPNPVTNTIRSGILRNNADPSKHYIIAEVINTPDAFSITCIKKISNIEINEFLNMPNEGNNKNVANAETQTETTVNMEINNSEDNIEYSNNEDEVITENDETTEKTEVVIKTEEHNDVDLDQEECTNFTDLFITQNQDTEDLEFDLADHDEKPLTRLQAHKGGNADNNSEEITTDFKFIEESSTTICNICSHKYKENCRVDTLKTHLLVKHGIIRNKKSINVKCTCNEIFNLMELTKHITLHRNFSQAPMDQPDSIDLL